MATLDPFEPWKHAEMVWAEAKRRGFEVVVALDDRTSVQDERRIVADRVIRWKSDGHCEDAFGLIQECTEDFVLLVADDEEPSELCWDFAAEPPFPARFGIPIIPYVSQVGKSWVGDVCIQERLIYRKGYNWVSRTLDDGTVTTFEGWSSGARQVTIRDNPGAIIWHYMLDAPREAREEKARRYARIDHSTVEYHRGRVIWEEHPEMLHDLPPHLEAQRPKEIERVG